MWGGSAVLAWLFGLLPSAALTYAAGGYVAQYLQTSGGRRVGYGLLIFATIILAGPLSASPAEDDAYGAFEFFCIENIANLSKFSDLLPPIGFTALSAPEAKPILGPHSGAVWVTKTKNTRLVLATEDGVACIVIAPDANPFLEESLLARDAVSRELHSEQDGSEIERTYAVTQRDEAGRPIRVIVILKYSTLKSLPGISMVALPASQFPNLKDSDWPQQPE